ncbi:ABC transporter permease [Streptomyces sp. SID14478]|uniref:ABC transporter permease n=1 Tax=Streptomyces sp. SID14478 TaxID=2706073 RepID=UPI0013D98D8B|nr:FtsX-like permease family protein [Streptomyces sp. SID14478]NEB74109.1 ABC transporter permease [Streptomyces sp. SID14478]
MNFLKRAWWRLTGHGGKTLSLTGLFLVICTLVLSGYLIQAAAARAAEGAKRQVGAVATMQLDVDALMRSGGVDTDGAGHGGVIGDKGDLHRSVVDKICAAAVVDRCNYTSDAGAFPTKSMKLYQPVPAPAGEGSPMTDLFKADGIRDLDSVGEFRNGDAELLSGHGITPDSKKDEIVVEERLAKANHLKVGDRLALKAGELPAPGQKQNETAHSFEVVGIYKSGTADAGQYVPPVTDPANHLYVSPDGASILMNKGTGKDGVVKEATFTLHDPDDLDALRRAAKSAGVDPQIFPLTVNDKQYRALVGPITKTADFATVTVWLVAVAGTVILALIVAASLRERRGELGILMSLGERGPRLLAQHLVEIVACALVAIGLATACSPVLSEAIGQRLLSSQVSAAREEAADRTPEQDYANTGGGTKSNEPAADPIHEMDVRLGPADITKIAATGLGIAGLATLVPGIRVLRLTPRDILTKGN